MAEDGQQQQTTPPPATGGGGDHKTFTQADVDRIVADRLGRERAKYADYDELKDAAQRLKDAEDADKTEVQRLTERLTAAEKRASDAEGVALRTEVAQGKGLTPAQSRWLQGATREELEAAADELLEAFAGQKPTAAAETTEGATGDGTDTRPGAAGTDRMPPAGRPKEKLTPGAVPPATGDKTPAELAEQILRSEVF